MADVDTQPTPPQCRAIDTHYGSGLLCQGQSGHDGPHYFDGATWPDENCYLCGGAGNDGPLAHGGRCSRCHGTGRYIR